MIRSRMIPAAVLLALVSTQGILPAAREVNAVAATVNGKVITEAEVRLLMAGAEAMLRAEYSGPELQRQLKETRGRVLQDLIDREIILSVFEERGGQFSDEYVDQEIERIVRSEHKGDREAFFNYLARAGVTNRKFRELTRKRLIVQVMRSQVTRNLPPPEPEAIRKEYNEMVRKIREEGGSIQFSKIFIPRASATGTEQEQRELAVEIRTKLLQGADFASLAREYSRDARASNGGEWPVMERRFLKREIADAAFATSVGSLSPLVEDETGWHIIKVEAKELGNAPSFEDLREQAARIVDVRRRAEVYEKWIETLRAKAVVKKF